MVHRRQIEKANALNKPKTAAKYEKKLEAIEPKIKSVNEEIERLVDEPDRVTGHAFVVFQLEEQRNRCIKLFQTFDKEETFAQWFIRTKITRQERADKKDVRRVQCSNAVGERACCPGLEPP